MVICGVSRPHFSTLSYKITIVGKEFIENEMRAFIFFAQFVLNIFYFKKNSARYYKCTWVFMVSTLYSLDFNKT
jgi:hypothetical protein